MIVKAEEVDSVELVAQDGILELERVDGKLVPARSEDVSVDQGIESAETTTQINDEIPV